jgi:signal transduction histidine kinase
MVETGTLRGTRRPDGGLELTARVVDGRHALSISARIVYAIRSRSWISPSPRGVRDPNTVSPPSSRGAEHTSCTPLVFAKGGGGEMDSPESERADQRGLVEARHRHAVSTGASERVAEPARGIIALLRDASDGAIAITLDESRVTDANRAAHTLLGLSRERLIGAPLDVVFGQSASALLADLRERGHATGSLTLSSTERVHPSLCAQAIAFDERHAVLLLVPTAAVSAGTARAIAHDVNNLLTVIDAGCSFAREALAHDRERAVEEIDEARRATARSATLLRRLFGPPREKVSESAIDAGEALVALLPTIRRLAGARVHVSLSTPGTAVRIPMTSEELERVMLNLVANAREAMPDGGTLDIEAAMENVDAARAGEHVVLRVRDSGTGMDAEVARRVFEPRFSTKVNGIATGIGLATVREIVTRSGGTISMHTSPGAGTMFEMHLPGAKPAIERTTPTLAEAAGDRPVVLLVDDEAPLRAIGRRILERHGIRVLEAATGAVALGLARESGRVDVLITDVTMPGMTGSELADELGRQYPGMSVLFVSGVSEDELERVASGRPGTRALGKPFTPSSLVHAVRELIAHGTPSG